MILILTNSEDATADYLSKVLAEKGLKVLRFDTDKIVGRVAIRYGNTRISLTVDGQSYVAEEFSAVWYRRPKRLHLGAGDESPEGTFVVEEWAEAIEGFFGHISKPKWINYPANNVIASHKLEQLSRASSFGLNIPDTLVTQDGNELRAFHSRYDGNIVVKPMATGYIERGEDEHDSLIYTNMASSPNCLEELGDLACCPTLFQERVNKRSDVRITMIDEHLHAVSMVASEGGIQRCDIRRNNMTDVVYTTIKLPDAVSSKLRLLVSSYDLRFAAVDMAVDYEDKWTFFEINPNGQWAWLDLCGVTNIGSSFAEVLLKNDVV